MNLFIWFYLAIGQDRSGYENAGTDRGWSDVGQLGVAQSGRFGERLRLAAGMTKTGPDRLSVQMFNPKLALIGCPR